jgi:hypothetical protein
MITRHASPRVATLCFAACSPLFEIAFVLVRFDHVARFIVSAKSKDLCEMHVSKNDFPPRNLEPEFVAAPSGAVNCYTDSPFAFRTFRVDAGLVVMILDASKS